MQQSVDTSQAAEAGTDRSVHPTMGSEAVAATSADASRAGQAISSIAEVATAAGDTKGSSTDSATDASLSSIAVGRPSGPASMAAARLRTWLRRGLLAAAAIAALVEGLLTVLGAATGPVFAVVAILTGLGAFLLFLWDALDTDLRPASTRRRLAYVVGALGLVSVLVVAGMATQTVAPLYRLGGTQDVGVVGFLAPSGDQQQVYDDVAASLTEQLQVKTEGEVHDYSPVAEDAPLREVESAADGPLGSWVNSFVDETQSELVIGGYGESLPSGQTALRVALFVSPKFVADASELAGWYLLDEILIDRGLASTRTRADLLDRVVDQVGDVTAVLRGLDAFQSGQPREAIEVFDAMVAERSPISTGSVADLVLLFRGHASEALAVAAPAEERTRLLSIARADYEAVVSSSVVAARARLSLASNGYLTVAGSGCAAGTLGDDGLASVSAELRDLASDESLAELTRLKATVNLAQVEQCRLFASAAPDDGTVDRLLADLTADEVPSEGPEVVLRRQNRALALSVAATHHAWLGRLNEAVHAMDGALALDSRFERQALWQGLKSGWLLRLCRVGEAEAAQEESLDQLGEAVALGRLPASEIELYSSAYEADRTSARESCNAAN